MPERTDNTKPSRGLAALGGLAAGGAAVAAAELTTIAGPTLRNPVLDVGDRFIAATPGWLKEFAISVFGTNDKLALLVGISLFLAGFAAIVGILGFRKRLVYGVIGIGLFGAIGIASALAGTGPIATIVPSVVAALAGIGVLIWLHGVFETNDAASDSRRVFLGRAGMALAGAAVFGVGGGLVSRSFYSIDTDGTGLPNVGSPLSAIPDGADLQVQGAAPFTTPNADFYRIDTALSVPRVDPDQFNLRLFGMVDREINLTYEDLLRRTQVESDITLTCVSNEVGGRLVGNARWQGVRLDTLLSEAGLDPAADQVVGRSVDDYTCGFPVSAAMDGRDALIAVGMNGEPLPIEHGFPARLIVPGLYGYVSATKWLSEIEITTFDAFDSYWVPRGWAQQAPIKTSSRIDTPGAFSNLSGDVVIAGVAWAQTRGIETVEVRIDDDEWTEAELGAEVDDTTWRQWKLPWTVTPGRHTITCRATDQTGELQTEERARPMPDGSTGWHSVVVMGEAA